MRKLIGLLTCVALFSVVAVGVESSPQALAVDSDQCESNKSEKQDVKEKDLDGEKKLSKFMHEKLTSSQLVLEGLMTEDYGKMKKGAQKMIQMSNATEWQVIEGPIFAQQSAEFRSAAKQVIKFADEKNIDGASLSYLHLTMTCINCHKKVNKVLISQR